MPNAIDKKALSEADIRSKYILPAILKAGWEGDSSDSQVREEVYLTDGRILVKGSRSARDKRKKADYILSHKPNLPIAVVEAKDNTHGISDGIQQALGYAEMLDIPFVYASNGDGFYEHDRTTGKERELGLDEFPSPQALWQRYQQYKDITPEQESIVTQPYHSDLNRTPRYYQQTAINRAVEAVAKGARRLLITMATGTGKTYVAFQIIHRLWKSQTKKRILFLADRNALIHQAKRKDFAPFGKSMTIIQNKVMDPAYEIYLALYQGLTNYADVEDAYREFSPDFFDLIVIDECHRGSADENSAWREILRYFESATHIGLTATPIETEQVSSSQYFGEPIFTYSLKQGIQDGFLAPYKVLRVGINIDLEGWRPEAGKTDEKGELVVDRLYNASDYDKHLIVRERTRKVAERITEFLAKTNYMDKTIVFCVNIDHAQRLRDELAKCNPALVKDNPKYVMKITGDDEAGKDELENFTNPESSYPVIATTSELMTTGIDAQTCKLIVLDANIQSMVKFKQIIGRGTRVNEDYKKHFFTIMDFRGATRLFADPAFDGEPIRVKEIGEDEGIPADDDEAETTGEGGGGNYGGEAAGEEGEYEPPAEPQIVNGVNVSVLNERMQFLDAHGKLITSSLKDYTRQTVRERYQTLEAFLTYWNEADKKQAIIDELTAQGIVTEHLQEATDKDMDIFDLVCYAAFDRKPLTRAERARRVQKRDIFGKYGEAAQKVLQSLLAKYATHGIEDLEDMQILQVTPFRQLGTPTEIIALFGGIDAYNRALKELQDEIYAA